MLVTATGSPDDLVRPANTLLAALTGEPVYAGDTPLNLTTSAGLVEPPATSVDANELLRAADIALSWSKTGGRNRWRLFDPDRNATDTARWALAASSPPPCATGNSSCTTNP